jgi:hypothetical protein
MMAGTIPQDVLADWQNRTVVSVSNLHWNNADHTMLTSDVLFQELEALGPVPFSTMADADTKHGVEIWTKAVAGDYGAIAEYVAPPTPIPSSVSARQFKLQLLAAGLLDQVEAWVASQPRDVQIAYANSGSFVRGEPMMQQGFTDLGFTPEQIDAFFMAAATL